MMAVRRRSHGSASATSLRSCWTISRPGCSTDANGFCSRAVRQRFEQLIAEASGVTYDLGEQRSQALAARILALAMSMRERASPAAR